MQIHNVSVYIEFVNNSDKRLSNIKSVSDYLIRETSSGRVRGLEYDPNDERTFNLIGGLDNNATHDAALFFGIPYAAPPVGENRFKGPKDPRTWDEIYDAHTRPASCAQKCHDPCPDISEDCLYLNIFTPKEALKEGKTEKLPVLVWFHGGTFTWGAGTGLSQIRTVEIRTVKMSSS